MKWRKIANAHVLFNVSGVLLTIWFVPEVARFMKRLIPDKNPEAAPAAVPIPEVG